MTLGQYFGLLALISVVPLVYCLLFGFTNFPPPEHAFLRDEAVAKLLGLNISHGQQQLVLLAGFHQVPVKVFFLFCSNIYEK